MTDDYPEETHLERIRTWPSTEPGWLAYCESVWCDAYGRVKLPHCADDPSVQFITGGWSGNESIISAMSNNALMWSLTWQSSHRGGLYVFQEPEVTP